MKVYICYSSYEMEKIFLSKEKAIEYTKKDKHSNGFTEHEIEEENCLINKNDEKTKTINILGTPYTIIENTTKEKFQILGDSSGVCDVSTKKIYIAKIEKDEESMQCLERWRQKVLRHEIVHAFLFESGLDLHCEFGSRCEELVDWIALQGPKMMECWKEVGAIE